MLWGSVETAIENIFTGKNQKRNEQKEKNTTPKTLKLLKITINLIGKKYFVIKKSITFCKNIKALFIKGLIRYLLEKPNYYKTF